MSIFYPEAHCDGIQRQVPQGPQFSQVYYDKVYYDPLGDPPVPQRHSSILTIEESVGSTLNSVFKDHSRSVSINYSM